MVFRSMMHGFISPTLDRRSYFEMRAARVRNDPDKL